MKKSEFITTLTLMQILAWVALSVADLVEENLYNSKILVAVMIILPMAIPVVYFVFEEKLCEQLKISKLKMNVKASIIWIIETIIMSIIIITLINANKWFIKQNLLIFLNGYEYMVYGVVLAIMFVFVLLFMKAVEFICTKVEQKINKVPEKQS